MDCVKVLRHVHEPSESHSILRTKIDSIFNHYDTDQDDSLNAAEFEEFRRATGHNLSDWSAPVDRETFHNIPVYRQPNGHYDGVPIDADWSIAQPIAGEVNLHLPRASKDEAQDKAHETKEQCSFCEMRDRRTQV